MEKAEKEVLKEAEIFLYLKNRKYNFTTFTLLSIILILMRGELFSFHAVGFLVVSSYCISILLFIISRGFYKISFIFIRTSESIGLFYRSTFTNACCDILSLWLGYTLVNRLF